jgi:hypothetical protein
MLPLKVVGGDRPERSRVTVVVPWRSQDPAPASVASTLAVDVEVRVTFVDDVIVLESWVPSVVSQYSVVPSFDICTVKFQGLGAPRFDPQVLVPSVPVTL